MEWEGYGPWRDWPLRDKVFWVIFWLWVAAQLIAAVVVPIVFHR